RGVHQNGNARVHRGLEVHEDVLRTVSTTGTRTRQEIVRQGAGITDEPKDSRLLLADVPELVRGTDVDQSAALMSARAGAVETTPDLYTSRDGDRLHLADFHA